MSGYASGVRVEHAVMHHLAGEGYFCSRAASSKGPLGDCVAVKQGEVLFVNVKRTDPPGPAERRFLLQIAALLPGVGVPLVALGPPSKLTYRRLTGPGPADWVSWTPDVVGGAA